MSSFTLIYTPEAPKPKMFKPWIQNRKEQQQKSISMVLVNTENISCPKTCKFTMTSCSMLAEQMLLSLNMQMQQKPQNVSPSNWKGQIWQSLEY